MRRWKTALLGVALAAAFSPSLHAQGTAAARQARAAGQNQVRIRHRVRHQLDRRKMVRNRRAHLRDRRAHLRDRRAHLRHRRAHLRHRRAQMRDRRRLQRHRRRFSI